jgi:hypothetical protein
MRSAPRRCVRVCYRSHLAAIASGFTGYTSGLDVKRARLPLLHFRIAGGRRHTPAGVTRAGAIVGPTFEVFLHQVGHAFGHVRSTPPSGRAAEWLACPLCVPVQTQRTHHNTAAQGQRGTINVHSAMGQTGYIVFDYRLVALFSCIARRVGRPGPRRHDRLRDPSFCAERVVGAARHYHRRNCQRCCVWAGQALSRNPIGRVAGRNYCAR